MTQPTGLYGWIRSNDGRSTTLFVGFLLAIQPIAALVLFLPLTLVDPDHAPFLNWAGYGTRYMCLVALASVVWFGCQMFWHVETVKRAVGFEFIDDSEEPRLCRLIEPLIIMLGLPVPYVGVIESPARNAFACGIGRKKAVVVVTRGLIVSLDDDELSAVLAHELSHIKNGDIRLMAAANIFMSALTRLHRNNPLQLTIVHASMAIAVPVILPLSLAGTLVGHLALRMGQISRLLISSSREFIADAEAAQLIKNPAALAAALVKVEHDYQVEGARTEDDAMMIAGATQGINATHPTVAQRIAALARTTGAMVFNTPSVSRGFGRAARSSTLEQAAAAALLRRLPPTRALSRIQAQAQENVVGLTRNGMLLAAATLVCLMCIHASELGNPRAIAAKFDIRPLSLLLGMPFACQYFPKGESCAKRLDSGTYRDFEGQKNTLAGWLADRSKDRRRRGVVNADITLANPGLEDIVRSEYRGQSGLMRGVLADRTGIDFATGGSSFSSAPPERLLIAELDHVGCFPATLTYGEPQGHYRIDQTSGNISMSNYEAAADKSLVLSGMPEGPARDALLRSYASTRSTVLLIGYDQFGLPGLNRLRGIYRSSAHQAVVRQIAERLNDPRFTAGMKPMDIAEIRALARSPEMFLPCPAIRHGVLAVAS